MSKHIEKEQATWLSVSSELMAQYNDGSHTEKDEYGLYWYHNGLWHRDGDKPAIIDAEGSFLAWWQNGKRHRDEDKPAVIGSNGELGWYQNGRWHRLHGPAVINSDGRLAWWINGKNITQEVNEWLTGEEWQGTPEQIVEFKLRFS